MQNSHEPPRGILGQPFLSFDHLIDLESFDSCRAEIWSLLSKATLEGGYYVPSDYRSVNESPKYKTLKLRNSDRWEDKHEGHLCRWSSMVNQLPLTKEFLQSLPFKELGRVKIFFNDENQKAETHRDHNDCYRKSIRTISHRHEFIWLNSDPDRQLFILNPVTGEKMFSSGRSLFFNEVDLHGAEPFPKRNFTLRVDGKFSEKLRNQTGIDQLDWY